MPQRFARIAAVLFVVFAIISVARAESLEDLLGAGKAQVRESSPETKKLEFTAENGDDLFEALVDGEAIADGAVRGINVLHKVTDPAAYLTGGGLIVVSQPPGTATRGSLAGGGARAGSVLAVFLRPKVLP